MRSPMPPGPPPTPCTSPPQPLAAARSARPQTPMTVPARAPHGRVPRSAPAGNGLRTAARLLSAAAYASDDPVAPQISLIIRLVALAEAIAGLRAAQRHAAQAAAARKGSRTLACRQMPLCLASAGRTWCSTPDSGAVGRLRLLPATSAPSAEARCNSWRTHPGQSGAGAPFCAISTAQHAPMSSGPMSSGQGASGMHTVRNSGRDAAKHGGGLPRDLATEHDTGCLR